MLNNIDLFQVKLPVGITAPFLSLQEIKPGTAKSLAAFCDTELHIWIAVIFLYFFLAPRVLYFRAVSTGLTNQSLG